MRTPLIAVSTYRLPVGRVTGWNRAAYAVPDSYVDAVRRAGGRPVLLPVTDETPAQEMLEPFDALLLIGGGDVVPGRYGATEQHEEVYGLDADRDRLEIGLVREADRERLPTLAICRGIQVMNVAFGGTLHQHLPAVPQMELHRLPTGQSFLHEVKVAEGSRLAEAAGSVAVRTYSAHHQGIDELGEGLAPVGWSGDGLVEAVERPEGWMLGVQWHPEETAPEDGSQQALFDALVARTRTRA